jgi:methionyl-tRNA synthetase
MNPPYYVTSAIPYVNARPHVGFAMELVLADVLARHHRQRGRDVRYLTGSDENSLKNVQAAEAEGIATPALVERNAEAYRALRSILDLSWDDFIRTSADARHREGVERLWRACAEAGDVYKRPYRGLYCVGCEQFWAEAELRDGNCPEHGVPPERVEEENWFFRLSRHAPRILAAIESNELVIAPSHYRNEILAFVRAGLQDFSISRSARRARGWGIPVPGDPGQVMYVWFDALGNYVTALDDALRERFWAGEGERVHVLGKGITRFHAVYWPAILASAGLAWPTAIAVHGYLTVEGRKIGKSLGNAIEPEAIVAEHGVDAVRWFLCRHVRFGRDGDFVAARLRAAHDAELADQLGNLLHRTVAMIERWCEGRVPAPVDGARPLPALADEVRARVESAFAEFRVDDALGAAWSIVEAANAYVVEQAPWSLARRRDDPAAQQRLRTTLYDLAEALRLCAVHLVPFIPGAAAKVAAQLGLDPSRASPWPEATAWGGLPPGTRVQPGPPIFPKAER